MKSIKTMLQPHRWILLTLISLFSLYVLMGTVFLPWQAEKQLSNILAQRLDVQAAIQKITFNPFTFELKVEALQLKTADSEPLVALGELYVNVDPLDLFWLDLTVDQISLVSPKLYFRRYTATENTLTRLAAKWAETSQSETSESAETSEEGREDDALITLKLNTLLYKKGELYYVDDVPTERFETVLSPINIHINSFSTQSGHVADNEIVIDLEKDAQLSIIGNFVLSPLHVDGRLRFKNLSLDTPYRYLKAMLPFELNQGRLNLDLNYNVDVNGSDVDIRVNQIQLAVDDFNIHQKDIDVPLIEAGHLTLSDGEYRYPKNMLKIANLNLNDYKVHVTQDEEGVLNWVEMLENMPEKASEDVAVEASVNPFMLEIMKITASNTQVAIEDFKPQTPLKLLLNIDSEFNNLSLDVNKEMPVSLDAKLDAGGNLNMQGSMQLFPTFAIATQLNIENLALLPFQSYLDELAFIDIKKGSVDAKVKLNSNHNEPFSLQGDVMLLDAQVDNKKLNEKLMTLDQLAFNDLDISSSKKDLKITEIIIDKLYSRVKITKGGETNVGLLIKKSAEEVNQPETVSASDNDAPEFSFSVGRVIINNASSSFTDENLPIIFNTNMQNLNGNISNFDSQSSQPVNIALEGQVDEFGLVEISGDVDLLDISNQTAIKIAFTNLTLPHLTPYTIKFAGREIDEGAGDIEVEYSVIQGELNASNKVLIRDIRLGERVESPDAMDLPLDLAIALLKNSDGVIEISIPVSGDLNDPSFDLGPVIRGAISSILGNIVTAPFRFLANLFGEGQEPVDDLQFRAGRSDITPPEQEKLLKLAKALQQRPQLVLGIPAPYDAVTDLQALKIKSVEARIEKKLEQTTDDVPFIEQTQRVLETLYLEARLSPNLDSIKQQLIASRKTSENPEGDLDVLMFNARLKSDLIEAEQVSQDELNKLAFSRQEATMTFIQSSGKLKSEQLQATDILIVDAKEGWLHLPFKLDAR